MQRDARQASRTKTKSIARVFAHPAQSLSEKTSTTYCSACLPWRSRHLGRNRTKRLNAFMFLAFGSCSRLASSFTANCSSHLSGCEIRISTWRGSASISHRSPASAPGGRTSAVCSGGLLRLDQHVLSQTVSESHAKRRPTAHGEVVTAAHYFDRRAQRLPLSNRDAELAKGHSNQVCPACRSPHTALSTF